MKVKYLVFILLLATGGVSYLYSGELYSFFIRTYYIDIMNETPGSMTARLRGLVREKRYPRIGKMADDILFLFPDDLKLRMEIGVILMQAGGKEDDGGKERDDGRGRYREHYMDRGARYVLNFYDGKPESRKHLVRALSYLHDGRLYKDFLEQYARFNIKNDSGLLMMKGHALYELGKYREAYPVLIEVEKSGFTCFELYYWLGLTAEMLKRYDEALKFLWKARTLKPMDRDLKMALIRIHGKTGKYGMAEKLLRRRGY